MIDRVKTNTPLPAGTKAELFANILRPIFSLLKLSIFFLCHIRVNIIVTFNSLPRKLPPQKNFGKSWQLTTVLSHIAWGQTNIIIKPTNNLIIKLKEFLQILTVLGHIAWGQTKTLLFVIIFFSFRFQPDRAEQHCSFLFSFFVWFFILISAWPCWATLLEAKPRRRKVVKSFPETRIFSRYKRWAAK